MMRRALSIVLGFAALLPFATTEDAQFGKDQPTVSAPHINPWRSLSEDESTSVNILLQQRLNLTGNQGSRYCYSVTMALKNY